MLWGALWGRGLAGIAAAALLLTPGFAGAAPFDADPVFNGGLQFTLTSPEAGHGPPDSFVRNGFVADADGHVVAATLADASPPSGDFDVSMTRLDLTGNPVSANTFWTGFSGLTGNPPVLAALPDGRFLLARPIDNASAGDIELTSFNRSGGSSSGTVIAFTQFEMGLGSEIFDAAVDSQGRVLLGLNVREAGGAGGPTHTVYVLRLLPNGNSFSIDLDFSGSSQSPVDGIALVDASEPPERAWGRAITIGPADEPHVAYRFDNQSATGPHPMVMRLRANGSPDAGWGGADGQFTMPVSGFLPAPDDPGNFNTLERVIEDLIVDSFGNAYTVGTISSGGRSAAFVSGVRVVPGNAIVDQVFNFGPPGGRNDRGGAIAFGQSGELIVGGAAVSALGSGWGVARIRRTTGGAGTLIDDTTREAFAGLCGMDAQSGVTSMVVEPIGSPFSGRVTLAGRCGGSLRVGRIVGRDPLGEEAGLDVSPPTAAAGHERIRLSALGRAISFARADLPTGDTSALLSAPLRNSPLRNSPLRNSPLRNSPLRNSPLRNSPLRNSGLAPATLSSIPLRNSGGWAALLVGTTYEGRLLQTITLKDVFALDPLPPAIAALTIADLDYERTGARQLTIASFVLDGVPMRRLPRGTSHAELCPLVDSPPGQACDAIDLDALSPAGAELLGFDLRRYYGTVDRELLVTGDMLDDDVPLGSVLVRDIELTLTDLGGIAAASVLSGCATEPCPGTLAELQASNANRIGDLTLDGLLEASGQSEELAELMMALLPPTDLPVETLGLDALLDAADVRSEDLQTYSLDFEVDCAQPGGVEVELDLPAVGYRVVPGTTLISSTAAPPATGPDPDVSGGRPRYHGPVFESAICAAGIPFPALVTVQLMVEPRAGLGTAAGRPRVNISAGGQAIFARDLDTQRVDDSRDAPDSPTEPAPELTEDVVRTGYVSRAGDIDTYRLVAPPAGSQVQVILSHLPKDFDLEVFATRPSVEVSPLRNSPLRNSPLRNSPVTDESADPALDPMATGPNALQDSEPVGIPLSTSIRRGTTDESASFIVLPAQAGQDIIVRVLGFGDVTSDQPYVLRYKVTDAPVTPDCIDGREPAQWPDLFEPEAPAGDTQTLVFFSAERMRHLYSDSDVDGLMEKLQAYAARDEVKGYVVPIDDSQEVRDAFDAWDASPCAVQRANDVAEEINAAVDAFLQDHPLTDLRHIVLVGSDQLVPHMRVTDRTKTAGQSDYADEVVVGDHDNPISRAFREGFLITDDSYGDFDPQALFDERVYVPDVAIARLVETPEEIAAQLDAYQAADGILDLDTAFVAGYDFLRDAATAIRNRLIPAIETNSLITDDWTRDDVLGQINRPEPGITSVNGHYDHFRAEPAVPFVDNQLALLDTANVNVAPGSLLFTIGCNAGVNLPDLFTPPGTDPDDPARLRDWAQDLTAAGGVFAANLGYGYGTDESIAYSERLATELARLLAGRLGSVGQALMLAKQSYAQDLAIADSYDGKSLAQLALYGLATYRVKSNSKVAQLAPSVLPNLPTPVAGATVLEDPVTVEPDFLRFDAPQGSFYTADNQVPLQIQGRPIQPRVEIDVTAEDGLPAHGFLIEELVTEDVADVRAAFTDPSIDLAARTPQSTSSDVVHPAAIQSVTRSADVTGAVDTLVLAVGQHVNEGNGNAGVGTQRLHRRVAGVALRSRSGDWTPPTIEETSGKVTNGLFSHFEVQTPDDDIARALVLYRDNQGQDWESAELARIEAGRWSGGEFLDAGANSADEFIVQLADEAGNVGLTTNKGPGYPVAAVTAEVTALRFVSDPLPNDRGWINVVSPSIELVDRGGASFTYKVRDAQPNAYTSAFTLPSADGRYTVDAISTDGSQATRGIFSVDTTDPVVTGAFDRAPEAGGWYRSPVTATFECTDATSGLEACTQSIELDEDDADAVAVGQAVDRADNEARIELHAKIDQTPPTVFAHPDREPDVNGWYTAPVTVTFTCEDATSGIAECPAPVTLSTETNGTVVDGGARDIAGNTNAGTTPVLRLDFTNPDGTLATKDGIHISLLGNGRISGNATDAFSGVGRVDVVFTDLLLGGQIPRQATIACSDTSRRSCTFAVKLPRLGSFRAGATVTDVAGHRKFLGSVKIVVGF